MTDEIGRKGGTSQLPSYRLTQKGVSVNIEVADLNALVTHHPADNKTAHLVDGVVIGGQKGRSKALIGAEFQEIEVRTPGRTFGLMQDQVLLKKDFILEDSRIVSGHLGARSVDVPSPLAGYIGHRNDAEGLVDILDQKDGKVIARVRHMDPITVNVGDSVQYGQAIGVQSNRATKPIHVHMEIDTSYYQHYENYIGDLVSGRLSIDPARRTQGMEARPITDDGVTRIGEAAGIVWLVQQQLNEAGFRGADGQPLQVDGVYRLSMQAAVINYQRVHGLTQSGDIDAVTLQSIAPRTFPPAVNDDIRGNSIGPAVPPYINFNGAQQHDAPGSRTIDDQLLPQAERAVQQMERELGREYDGHSARLAASAACLAKANGLTRIDHVLLSEPARNSGNRENVFVVQGRPSDPAHQWACMKTQDAINAPVEQSLARLEHLNSAQGFHPGARRMEDGPQSDPSPRMQLG